MTSPNITEMRQALLDTLHDLRDREHPMEPDRARAVAQVAGVLVDSAKVEVEYLRVTQQDTSAFLDQPGTNAITDRMLAKNTPFPGGAVHRIKG